MNRPVKNTINNAGLTQITRGHRLIKQVMNHNNTLYPSKIFDEKKIITDADYWLEDFLPKIVKYTDDIIQERINALPARFKLNESKYNSNAVENYKILTEVFFDKRLFRVNDQMLSREKLCRHLENLCNQNIKLNLAVPMMYLKPYSPLKNKGKDADFAELFTVINFKIMASLANHYSPTGAKLTILADGNKYNRACLTPKSVTESYQKGVKFWIDKINAQDLVKCIDYEEHVSRNLSEFENYMRQKLYLNNCEYLSKKYGKFYDSNNIKYSITALENFDNIGSQLAYTFYSHATTVNYENLREYVSKFSEKFSEDLYNILYSKFIYTLYHNINNISFYEISKKFEIKSNDIKTIFMSMRKMIWDASIRYVAISLTDRNLNVLNRTTPDLVKLTIHPKLDEIGIVSSNRKYVNMLCQHCTAGFEISKNGVRPSYKYRCIREQEGEHPVYLKQITKNDFNKEKYGPLYEMSHNNQPLCYVISDLRLDITNLSRLFDKKFI